MRAAAIDRFGPPSVLKTHELPIPSVGAHDVLIGVHTAGVATWDPDVRTGAWAAEGARFPRVLGTEGSGTVVARGARVRRLRVGDKVYGVSFDSRKSGFYAEYTAVAAQNVARIPRRLDLLHAGALPAVALTALRGIDDALEVKRDESVVVLGASGNVGVFAVQFAKQRGAAVLAIASGRDGCALAKRLGADVAIDGKRADVADELVDFAPDGVDAVLGLTGGTVLTKCIAALRRGGRIAYPNGIEPAPRKRRGIKLVAYDAKPGVKQFARLTRALDQASLIVPIAKQFPLGQAAQAHRLVEKGHLLGRVVLRVARRR
ncbi:MAG TPA: NADP-dependent oxidoreductase [Gemmatimonadaceae bacterium]|jgi:NADPH:quinone reductase-like Zn-dependent oxidoreductase